MNLLRLIILMFCTMTCFINNIQASEIVGVKKILLRSSWQTINIGDIAHTPGICTLIEKYIPEANVVLWAGDVRDGVKEMLLKRFPNLEIIENNDPSSLAKAFMECDFFLHGSGPWLVMADDVNRWIKETGKPFGVYGITLPEERVTPFVVDILNKSSFVFFRDTPSLEVARKKGVKAKVMGFAPDAAFAVDLRNDSAALEFMKENNLEEGKYVCVIPKYRKTPNWLIKKKKAHYDRKIDELNQSMKEHDIKPYRDAIIKIVESSDMKVLICPEDVTQVALGKEMLYDPLPEDIKKNVVWRDRFWLTDEALSVYVRSAGLFGLEQHSPIMCIANGVPAFVGRFKEQTSKGYMWHDIGLGDWMFDSDVESDMKRLIPCVMQMIQNNEECRKKASLAKDFVETKQKETMGVLRCCLLNNSL